MNENSNQQWKTMYFDLLKQFNNVISHYENELKALSETTEEGYEQAYQLIKQLDQKNEKCCRPNDRRWLDLNEDEVSEDDLKERLIKQIDESEAKKRIDNVKYLATKKHAHTSNKDYAGL